MMSAWCVVGLVVLLALGLGVCLAPCILSSRISKELEERDGSKSERSSLS